MDGHIVFVSISISAFYDYVWTRSQADTKQQEVGASEEYSVSKT